MSKKVETKKTTTLIVPYSQTVVAGTLFFTFGQILLNHQELDKVFQKAFKWNCPYVIDCKIDKDKFVLPMLPPGGSMADIITRPEVKL